VVKGVGFSAGAGGALDPARSSAWRTFLSHVNVTYKNGLSLFAALSCQFRGERLGRVRQGKHSFWPGPPRFGSSQPLGT